VLQDGHRFACVARAAMRGEDFYCAMMFKHGAELMESIHRTGMSHTKVLGQQRLVHPRREPLRDFTLMQRVLGGTLNALDLHDWLYRPKADRLGARLSLVVRVDELLPSSGVDIWLAERRLENELRAEWHNWNEVVIGAAVARWVEPEIGVVVGTVKRGVVVPSPLMRTSAERAGESVVQELQPSGEWAPARSE